MGLMDWFRGQKRRTNRVAPPAVQPSDAVTSPPVKVLSLLGPDFVFKEGLSGPAIAGVFRAGDLTPENFIPNRVFVDFLQSVIRRHAPNTRGFAQAALESGVRSLVIIDHRTPEGPQGNVPPEDIFGAFEIVDGKASAETYQVNPQYRVYTGNGLPLLPEPLHSILLSELRGLV